METLWRWMMHANSRRLFGCSLIALIAVSGYWIYRDLTRQFPSTNPATKARHTRDSFVDLGLRGFLDDQLARGASEVPLTPFRPPKPERRTIDINLPKTGVGPWVSLMPAVDNNQPPVRPSPPLPPAHTTGAKTTPAVKVTTAPTKSGTTVVYKGVLRRTDGQQFACMRVDDRTEFVPGGTNLHGVVIGFFDREAAEAHLSNGDIVSLEFGVTNYFEEGKHAGEPDNI